MSQRSAEVSEFLTGLLRRESTGPLGSTQSCGFRVRGQEWVADFSTGQLLGPDPGTVDSYPHLDIVFVLEDSPPDASLFQAEFWASVPLENTEQEHARVQFLRLLRGLAQ